MNRKYMNIRRTLCLFLSMVLLVGSVPYSSVTAADGDACSTSGCTGTFTNGFCSVGSTHYETPAQDANGAYQIANAGQLYYFASLVNSGNNSADAVLIADITVNTDVVASSSGSRVWTPIGNFEKGSFFTDDSGGYAGTFDGNCHTISGLYASTSDSYVGFVDYLLGGGTVKNLGIVDSYFTGSSYVGTFTGYNEGNINNCHNYPGYLKATASSSYVGGIAGCNDGTVSNCYTANTVQGNRGYVGAVLGRNNGTCSNTFYLTGCALNANSAVQNGIGGSILSGSASDTANVTTAVSVEQFASGEVGYLLQNANSELIWGQKSTVLGTGPCLTRNEFYAIAKFDSGEGYSVTSLGDLNGDFAVNVEDYQLIVNIALGEENTEEKISDRLTFIRADITGDGVVDVLDIDAVLRMYYGQYSVPIYSPGDFNGDGVCTDEDTKSIKQTVTNEYYVGKSPLYSCDFNGDGYLDGDDLEYAYGVSAAENYVYFDTKYGDHERQRFDLYIPKDKKIVGMVLMLHGGAWLGGDKGEYAARLEEFAAKGYAGVAVNYRYICDTVNLDDIMDDIEMAVALVKEIADSHGVEISGFLSTGGSAGGHLALHYAYSRADTSAIPPTAVVSYCGPADLSDEYYYYNEELQKNNGLGDEEYVAQILGWASGYAHTYATREQAKDALKFVSPIYYIDENTVPTVINHGMQDDIVPFRNAEELDAKLTEYGIEHVFNAYPNSGHGLSEDAENMALAEQLLQEYVVKYLDSVDI